MISFNFAVFLGKLNLLRFVMIVMDWLTLQIGRNISSIEWDKLACHLTLPKNRLELAGRLAPFSVCTSAVLRMRMLHA